MKKRIADIVTEFSVEGLAAVQKALKKLAKDVRESGAKSERLDKHTESAAIHTERAAVAMNDVGQAADRAAASTDDLSKSLDKSHDAASRTAVSLEKVDTAADEAGRSVARSSDDMDDLSRNAGNAAGEVEDLRRDVERVAPAADQAAEAVDEVADAAERASPHVAEIERGLDSSADSSDRVSESLRDVGERAREVSRDTDRVDAALSDAARSAGRTEDALGDVGRSAGAAADDVDRIRDAARDVGPNGRRAAAAVSDVGNAAGDAARDVARVGDGLEDTARPASRLTLAIGRVRAVVQGVVDQLRAAGRSIRASLGAAPAAVVRAMGVARSYVASTISALGGRVQVFSGLVGQALGDVAARTTTAFRSVRSTVAGALSGLASLAARSATDIGNGLATGLVASRAVVRAALSSVLAGALSGLTGLRGLGRSAFDGLVQGARAAGAAIRTGFQSSLVGLGTTLATVGSLAGSTFNRLNTNARRAFRALRPPLQILRSQISAISSSIVQSVMTVPSLLQGALSGSMTAISGAATLLVSTVGTAVVTSFAAARNAISAGMGIVGGLVSSAGVAAGAVLSGIGTAVTGAFSSAGVLLSSALGGMITGLSSLGGLAAQAFGGIASLVGSTGALMGTAFAAGGQLAFSAMSNLGTLGSLALAGIISAVQAIGRGFAAMARGGMAALRAIGSAAAGVARGIVSAFAGVGRSIAGALTSKGALLAGAGVGLGNLGVKGIKAFSPLLGLGAGAVAGIAGIITMKDVKVLRQASDALGLPVDVIQQWDYLGSQVGSTTEEVLGAMHALKSAQVGIASGDEAFKGVAEVFKKAGLEVADSSGRFKTATALMADLALATRRLNTEQKNYIFSQLFGEADALALGTLFKNVGANYEALNANFQMGKERGQFITPQQMAQLSEFQLNFANLVRTLKTLARELFLAFEPFFSQFIKFTNIKFAMPEARTDWIDRVFVKPFQRGFQLLMDIMKAFWSFDFEGWFTGKSMGGVTDQNMWLYDVKKAALDVWAVFQGLVQLVYGVAEAFLSLFRAVDEVVVLLTGFSMEGWIVVDGAKDFEAFARDVRKIMATLFGAPVDMSMLTTSFGKSLAAGVESIKSVIAPIWQAIVRDLVVGWNEFLMSLEDDRPLTAFYSWTGATLKLLNDFRKDLVGFGKALWDVLVEGQPAPEQFSWLDDLKVIFEGIGKAIGAVAEAMKLLAPAYDVLDGIAQSFAGISGATALLLGAGLGRLGVLFAGLAAPLGVALVPLLPYAAAIGAVVGGIYLLYNLLTDFTGTIERIVQAIEWAWNKIGFGGGDNPSDDLTSDEATGPKRIDYMMRRSDLDIERQDIEARIAATTDEAALKALQAELAKNSAALAKVTSELDAFDAAGSKAAAEPVTDPTVMSTAGQTMGREAIAAQIRAADAARSQATQAIRAQAAQAPEIRATSAEVETATATTTGTATTNAQTATVQAGETKVDAATVQILTDQVPVTVNLGNGVTATGLFQRDQADEIVRAAANRIGGSR